MTTSDVRLYDLYAVNQRTGARTKLTGYPMTHKECCTMRSKFTRHSARHIVLDDAKGL